MNKNWPTKHEDMHIAQLIMEEHALEQNTKTIDLFELVVNHDVKQMGFRLSNWVLVMAQQFNSMYGANQGEYVTRQVISCCIIQDHTLH